MLMVVLVIVLLDVRLIVLMIILMNVLMVIRIIIVPRAASGHRHEQGHSDRSRQGCFE